MRWRRYFERRRRDDDFAKELAAYVAHEFDQNVARGMDARQARDAAVRKLGNRTALQEEIHRMNSLGFIESVWQDVRYGSRALMMNPGFASVAILSLALGIGANTAIFELLDAVRLRSLPVKSPHELAEVRIAGGNGGMGSNDEYGELTRPMWEEIRRSHPPFSGVLAWSKHQLAIGQGSSFQLANSIAVSGDFFRVLGVEPWRGRMLFQDDEHACPESTAVVSYAYWQSKLGGRALNSDTKLLIDGELKQVVGVTPPRFLGLAVGERFDIAFPMCRPKELSRNVFNVTVFGRLRPGWTVERASAQLAAQSSGIMAATEIQGYNARTVETYLKFKLAAYSASAGVSNLRKEYDSSLWLLLAITGLVLLIACANLANLMLARASVREREIAVRLALGAARTRLLRQLLIESALLAGMGTALGVGLAQLVSRFLISSLSTQGGKVTLSTGTDWHVLLFAAGVAALTCILFGAAPAVKASASDPATAMKTGSRGTTAGRERFSVQRVMVVSQVSVSLLLLVGALLFVRSFYNLMTVNLGMREKGITIASIGFLESNIPQQQIDEFKRRLLEDIRSVPGVVNAATTTRVPLDGGSWGHGITIGRVEGGSRFTWVSPSYFETMDIPLLSGRSFTENDTSTSQRVAVVNQTFVRRFSNGLNPIGRTLRTSPEPNYPSTVYQIVGVIPDTKYNTVRGEAEPITFAPASQFPNQRPWTDVMIRSDIAPAIVIDSVKKVLATRHPEMFAQYRVFKTQIEDGLVRERLMAILSGFFGLLAAVLAMIGLYGVISYIVTRRRNEIGIRVALGANHGQVIGLVMREAGLLLVIGVSLGIVLSLAASRGAGSLLFGLAPYDPLTLALAAGLLAAIGALAGFLPAHRASKVDPMTALRCE
jgi:predicted permease